MVLAAIVLVVTGATRIEVTRARAELALVDLVGGTQRYARRPFVYMGLVQGLAGGLLASAFVYGGAILVGQPLSRLLTLYGESAAWSAPLRWIWLCRGLRNPAEGLEPALPLDFRRLPGPELRNVHPFAIVAIIAIINCPNTPHGSRVIFTRIL